jgi:iron complex outermembrane receptor protein
MYRNDPSYGYIANPDLDPETTNTFEIGMKKQIGTKTNLTMSVYHAKTKDMIIAVKRADGKRWYVNQDQARRIGAELDVNHTFGQFFSAYANYSYEQAKDENGDRIYSIPRHIFHSGIQYNREKWNAYLEGQYISGRNEPGNVAHRLYSEDAVFTMNLGVNVQVCKGAVLGLTVNNLLDKEYWAWQKAAGRTYTVSLQYEI